MVGLGRETTRSILWCSVVECCGIGCWVLDYVRLGMVVEVQR